MCGPKTSSPEYANTQYLVVRLCWYQVALAVGERALWRPSRWKLVEALTQRYQPSTKLIPPSTRAFLNVCKYPCRLGPRYSAATPPPPRPPKLNNSTDYSDALTMVALRCRHSRNSHSCRCPWTATPAFALHRVPVFHVCRCCQTVPASVGSRSCLCR